MFPRRVVLTVATALQSASATELTFKVPPASTQCFREDIEANKQTTVTFVVVSGGKSDVVMTLKGPNIHQGSKKPLDVVTIMPNVTGAYTLCFSNEFYVVSDKRVYMSFQLGEKSPLRQGEKHASIHDIEFSLMNVRDRLNAIVEYQTPHRLRESQGHELAKDLNEYVLFWPMIKTLDIPMFFYVRSLVIKRLLP